MADISSGTPERRSPKHFILASAAGIANFLTCTWVYLSSAQLEVDTTPLLVLIGLVFVGATFGLLASSILLLVRGEIFRAALVGSCVTQLAALTVFGASAVAWGWTDSILLILQAVLLAFLLPDLMVRGVVNGELRCALLTLAGSHFAWTGALDVFTVVKEVGIAQLISNLFPDQARTGLSDYGLLGGLVDSIVTLLTFGINVVVYNIMFRRVWFLGLTYRAIRTNEPFGGCLLVAVIVLGGLAMLSNQSVAGWEVLGVDLVAVYLVFYSTGLGQQRAEFNNSGQAPYGQFWDDEGSPVAGLSDPTTAGRGRRDGLDLLVDAEIRCPACKWKPPPSQTWTCPDCDHEEVGFILLAGCSECSSEWSICRCPACSEVSRREDWYEALGLAPV